MSGGNDDADSITATTIFLDNPTIKRHSESLSDVELKTHEKIHYDSASINSQDQDDCSEIALTNQRFHSCSLCHGNPLKNLFAVSISFMITLTVFFAEVSLQSSINEDNGLGLTSLCVLYFAFILSCLYSAALMRLIGTKYTIAITYTGATIYTLANFYPSWYTLIFGSVVLGSVIGPLWASQSVHITTIAHQYASMTGKQPEKVVFLFVGIYTFIFKLSYVPANIISSVVLLNGRSPNASIIDSSLGEVCNNTEAANIDQVYFYILLSIYLILNLVAIILLVVFVDHIKTDAMFTSLSQVFVHNIKKPIFNTLKHVLSWEINVLTIMMILDGYSMSFVFGLFSKVV